MGLLPEKRRIRVERSSLPFQQYRCLISDRVLKVSQFIKTLWFRHIVLFPIKQQPLLTKVSHLAVEMEAIEFGKICLVELARGILRMRKLNRTRLLKQYECVGEKTEP